tara:strand:- start:245 stop:775 length:531 start_codon:yes stop_codon:yes gene_type:complete
MNQEKEKWLKPELMDNRNKIIGEFLDSTFDEALGQLDERFETETDFSNRLALFAARSWLIRKKVHVLIHEPFAFSIGDLEGLDISPTPVDDEEDNLAASLFDDDDDDDDIVVEAPKKVAKKKTVQTDDTDKPQTVKISIIKNMTLNGVKLLKDMVLEVSSADAGKLVAENKARIVE